MEVGTIIAFVGIGLTVLGLIVSVMSFTRRLRDAEIQAAEERGKMSQRVLEVEQDVNHIGSKVRNLEAEQHDVRQVLVKLETGQEYIIATLNELRNDQKEHERSTRGGIK